MLAGDLSIYVDGSCSGNVDVDESTPAGWGVVLVKGDTGLGKGFGEVIREWSDRKSVV